MNNCFARCIRFLRQFYIPYASILLSVAVSTLFLTNDARALRDELALILPVSKHTEWWRFFTLNLVHSSEFHLWSNVSMLLTAGVIFELIHGTVTTFVVFIVGGTTGILTFVAFNSQATSIVGASAGVYAIIASYGASLVLNWKETPLKQVWLLVFLVFVALEIYVAVTGLQNSTRIAHIAHIGGFIQGLLTGLLCVNNRNVLLWEMIVTFSAFLLAVSFILSLGLQITENTLSAG